MEGKNSGHGHSFAKYINNNLAFFQQLALHNSSKRKIIMNRGKHELKEFVYLHNRSYSERVSEGELARIHVYPKP